MVRTSRLPTGELLARTKGAAQHSIEREAIAPSGVLACGMSAYVRLRAQAGVSSKRRIYSDERLSRAARVKSQCLPTGEYVSPRTSRVPRSRIEYDKEIAQLSGL